MADEQTNPDGLGNIRQPKSKEPDTSLNPDVENVRVLTESLPQIKGQNPYYVKKKLLEDNELFEKTSRQVFVQSMGADALRGMEDDVFKQTYQRFQKNFRKDLVDSSYSGQDISETLIDRSLSLADSPQEINATDYASAIKSNPKKYKQTGLLDDNGEFLYENEDTTFADYVSQNPKLHRQIQQDRFKSFENELSKHHNKVDGLDTPAMKTKAWVVYDKQGPEGLTKFVNGLQSETVNDQFDEDDYLQRTKVGEKTLGQHYQRFVVGNVEDTEYGEDIAETAYKYDLKPSLLSGLVAQESSFNPKAVSNKGAVGITQLMPATAREYGLKVPDELYELDKKRINSTGQQRDQYARELAKRTKELGVDPENDQRYDPKKALDATGKYLGRSTKKYKDNSLAVASYHAGNRGVDIAIEQQGQNWQQAVPDSTRDYVQKVNANSAKYASKSDSGLVFRPRKPRKDITSPIPKDLSNYTLQFYNKDGKTKEPKQQLPDFVSKYVPQNKTENFSMERYYAEGDLSEEARNISDATYKEAQRGDEFNFEDLMNSLFAQSEATGKNQFGNRYYQIQYKNLPWHGKNAFNTIRQNPKYENLIEDKGDGIYRIIPNRAEGVTKAAKRLRDIFYDTEKQIKYNDDGTTEVVDVPDTGPVAQLWNAGVNLMFGGGHMANKYIVDPLAQGLNKLTGGEYDFLRETAEATEEYAGISLSELSNTEQDGWLPNAAEEVAPFAWYMTSMFAGGGAIKNAIGKAMQLGTRSKASFDAMRLGRLMNGSSKMSAVGKAIEQSNNTAIKFYAGGAGLEALTPKQDSFYNIIPELVGQQDNAVTNFYNTTNTWTRTAMDVAGSLMLDFGIDSIIGASKFMKDKAAKRFFDRNEFKSYEYTPKVVDGELSGTYRVKDTPTFTHEVRTFYHEIMDGLANKPIGDAGQTLAKGLTPDDRPDTIHDIVKQFSDKATPVMDGMKAELKEHIGALHKKFAPSGVELSPQQLDELTEAQYNRFIETSADNLHKLFKESDGEFTQKFATALEQQLPKGKQFKVGGRPIRPEEAPRWIDKGYQLVVKGDNVFEVSPNFWHNDLAGELRRLDQQVSSERVLARKKAERGLDGDLSGGKKDELLALTDRVRSTIGTPVRANGKIGYVVDFDDAGYKVRTTEGDIQVGSVKSDLTEGEINEMFVEGLAADFVRKRQPISELTEQIRPQRLLPEANIGAAERQYLEQIDEIEGQIKTLQQRHKNLDTIVDDSTRRGQMRRDITNQIKELRSRKSQTQRDLSKFYLDNPQVQKNRVQDYIDGRTSQRIELAQSQKAVDSFKRFAEELDRLTKTNSKIPFC